MLREGSRSRLRVPAATAVAAAERERGGESLFVLLENREELLENPLRERERERFFDD